MAQGFFAGGNGTKESPFLIEDADDLNAMRMHLDSYFELINDINLSNGKYNLNQGWQPIKNFTGTLNGANHKIINLYINRPTEDMVGFFKQLSGNLTNIYFVDAQIVGHDCVGVVTGILYTFDNPLSYTEAINKNICVVNSFVKANAYAGGYFGIFAMNRYSYTISDVFVEVNIDSKDSKAFGFGTILDIAGRERINVNNISFDFNCNCNCDGRWSNQCNCVVNNIIVNIQRCATKIHKNKSITEYYAFVSGSSKKFTACITDNSEIAPMIETNIEYKNILNIEYATDLLPNVDSNYFTKKVNAMLEPKFLNNDSIYLQFNNGYYVYDFTNNEFVLKYTKFSNENSKEIIQNGMDKVSFSKIPNSKLKEIQDKYGKVKVVNCINAHKRIVYKTNTLEMNRDKAHSVYRKKIRFDNFNEITSIKKK